MRRADRLFQLVQLIRSRRLTTASFLAQRLEVSERTVYRDVADLQHQGLPIEGEAGVGYRFGKGFDLPPLMFTQEEAAALVAAARIAQNWVDTSMSNDIEGALGKILSVMTSHSRASAEAVAIHVPKAVQSVDTHTRKNLQTLREAVRLRHVLRIRYNALDDAVSERTVRPLGCFYWGAVWTLAAWCELRDDFRGFRIDRIESIATPRIHFSDESGKTLADFLHQVRRSAKPAG